VVLASTGAGKSQGRVGVPTTSLVLVSRGAGVGRGHVGALNLGVLVALQARGQARGHGGKIPGTSITGVSLTLTPFIPAQVAINIGMPQRGYPIGVDAQGNPITMNEQWFRLLLALWNRTGGPKGN
jgi:hypothetical protein